MNWCQFKWGQHVQAPHLQHDSEKQNGTGFPAGRPGSFISAKSFGSYFQVPSHVSQLNATTTTAIKWGCCWRLLLCTIKSWDITAAATTHGAGRRCLGMYVLKRKAQAGFRRNCSVGNPSLAQFLLKCWKSTLGAARDLLGGQKMWPLKHFGALGKLCLCRRAIWLITPAALPRKVTTPVPAPRPSFPSAQRYLLLG